MGNSSSSSSNQKHKFKAFDDIVDFIASDYILTMNFQSLSKLSDKAYCDNLVVLTSDILDKYFNNMEIQYLSQRVKGGVEVNEMESKDVSFINKQQLETLDISNDVQKSIKKKRVCIGIAKFYVKIAHVFAAIITTINPVYSFKDQYGQTQKVPFMQKDKIPKNVDRKVYKLNICDNRIRALQRGESIDQETNKVTLHPRICDMNAPGKTLDNEPGIPELMRLYFDDEYDYSNGSFTGMSDLTKQQFMKDLEVFYKAFTGNDNMPNTVQKFSDIKLRDYSQSLSCSSTAKASSLNQQYTLDKNDKLFVQYAQNTREMIERAKNNQMKLLDVINDLFTYVVNPYNSEKVIRVNPKLTEQSLQNAVEKTRKYIINLYVACENDYVNGVKLFEAIVESKIMETTQKQIQNLKNKANDLVQNSDSTERYDDGNISGYKDIGKPMIRPSQNLGYGYQPPKPLQPNLGYGYQPNPGQPNLGYGYQSKPIQPNLGQPNLGYGYQPKPLVQPNLGLGYQPKPIQPNLGLGYLPKPVQSNLGLGYQPKPVQSNLGLGYQPKPIQSNPIQPNLVQPNLVQPNLVQPNLVQPNLVQPKPVQPNLGYGYQPKPIQPNPGLITRTKPDYRYDVTRQPPVAALQPPVPPPIPQSNMPLKSILKKPYVTFKDLPQNRDENDLAKNEYVTVTNANTRTRVGI